MITSNDLMELSKKYDKTIVKSHVQSFHEVEKILQATEEVLCVFTGSYARRTNSSSLNWVVVAITNHRLLIGGLVQGFFKTNYTVQSFDIDKVNAVSQTYAGVGGRLVFDTLGDDICIGTTSREMANDIAEDVGNILYNIKNSQKNTVNNTSQPSAADELKKFKELLDMGVITQEEFDQKKKQLLGL